MQLGGSRVRQRWLRGLSVTTSLAGLVISGLLMGSHMPFRTGVAAVGAELRRSGSWRALYILGEDCPCSDRLARHLCERKRLPHIREEILYVGSEPAIEQRLIARGWPVTHPAADAVRDLYGARSAPLLVLVDPAGEIRYLGGLARRSDFRDGFQEAAIWDQVRAGASVKPLPAYGCALTFGCGSGGLKEAAANLSR